MNSTDESQLPRQVPVELKVSNVTIATLDVICEICDINVIKISSWARLFKGRLVLILR